MAEPPKTGESSKDSKMGPLVEDLTLIIEAKRSSDQKLQEPEIKGLSSSVILE